MAEATVTPGNPTRRVVVAAAGSAGIAAALTACSSDTASTVDTGVAAGTTTAPGAVATTAAPGTETSAAAGAAAAIATTADIPEGGGKVFETEKVVVVQPTAGQFMAFSAVCTHQGCLVNEIANGTINCPCHGAKFNIADGSVAAGPAAQPLAAANITVNGTAITLG